MLRRRIGKASGFREQSVVGTPHFEPNLAARSGARKITANGSSRDMQIFDDIFLSQFRYSRVRRSDRRHREQAFFHPSGEKAEGPESILREPPAAHSDCQYSSCDYQYDLL